MATLWKPTKEIFPILIAFYTSSCPILKRYVKFCFSASSAVLAGAVEVMLMIGGGGGGWRRWAVVGRGWR